MPTLRNGATLGGLAIVYFMFYPQDLNGILAPFERLLAVSNSIAPGLYAVIAVVIAGRTAERIWGHRSQTTPSGETSRS